MSTLQVGVRIFFAREARAHVVSPRRAFSANEHHFFAGVAELVDALDLGSSGVTRESSNLSFRTNAEVEIISSEGYLFGLKLA